jgi:hypothetical protein
LFFFCGLPHYWQKIWGPMKRSKALHPCFVHALYFDRILHLHWGEMDSKEDGNFKNWLFKDISSRA